jgi:uncharacterized protein (DUF58 family)
MDTKDLLKKIKLIEIKTRGLTKQIFSGEYKSSFKGRGMAFSEVRNYQLGDEVRTIDWNVTARFNDPFVKVFEEERELTIILIIDISGSSDFGTKEKTKKELAIELSAVLGFSAVESNDKVGAIFVSDKVEKYIAPEKGKKHVLFILRELIEFKPESLQTNLNEGLKFFRNVQKKRSIGFVISDFLDSTSYIEGFKIAKRNHDMLALRLVDSAEYKLIDLGVIQLFNAETGTKNWVNTSSEKIKQKYKENFQKFEDETSDLFRRNGIDHVKIKTGDDYIPILIQLFKSRK